MIKKIAIPIFRKIRKIKRKIELHFAPTIAGLDLKRDLFNIGIRKGDVVLIHSSLKSIGYVEGGAQAVLSSVMELVSNSGTVVIPTYHNVGGSMYATCQSEDYIFDPRDAPTHLGAIPSAALTIPGFKRSIHPTHSVSAIGNYAEYITEAHHNAKSTFGADSPWDRLIKLNGKVLGIGVSIAYPAFYHMVEDIMLGNFPVKARMQESYRVKCRDWNGNTILVEVNPLDPIVAQRRIDQKERDDLRNYFWKEFLNAGILTSANVGQSISWIANSRRFYEHLVHLAGEGITIYSTEKDLLRRPV